MHGAGFIDWIKKHKKGLGIAAGTVASIAGLALLGSKRKQDSENEGFGVSLDKASKFSVKPISVGDYQKMQESGEKINRAVSGILGGGLIEKGHAFGLDPEIMKHLKHDNLQGAGFKKLAKSTFDLLNPVAWKRVITNWKSNVKNKAPLDEEEKIRAHLAKESYQKHENRKDIGKYKYHKEDSSHNYALYRDPSTNKNILVFKGTSDLKDIIPDLAIAGGIQDYSPEFKMANDVYKNLQDKYKGDWETVGHSLGGAKAMWVAQQNDIKSHAFNPGYVASTDDRIDPSYKKHNLYVVKGDPISNSILGEKLENVKVMDSVSYNPIENHSISSFTN